MIKVPCVAVQDPDIAVGDPRVYGAIIRLLWFFILEECNFLVSGKVCSVDLVDKRDNKLRRIRHQCAEHIVVRCIKFSFQIVLPP